MKLGKEKRIIFIFLFVFLLCGCEKNKLICHKTDNNEIYDITIKFKDNKPFKTTYNITYLYAKDDAYIDMKLLELQEEYGYLNNYNGIKHEAKITNDELYLNVKIDHSIDSIKIEKIPVLMYNLETNELALQSSGYDCKRK